MQELIEKWKTIPGYEGFYECSNLGEIRSIDRLVEYKHHGKPRFWPSRIINGYIPANGYRSVLLKKCGVLKSIMVHRTVGLLFKEKPNANCNQINHIDGNKLNNREDNLEWTDQSKNMIHAFANGLHTGKGATHYKAKRVINNITGEIFNTIQDAADSIGINRMKLWRRLSGNLKNKTDFKYLE